MRLRFGVLGTGPWARACHGAVLARHPDLDFTGFWGRSRDRAQAASVEVGAGRGFDRLDELLEAVDVVSVALPPAVQAELAVRAAQAGKHLLLDKPLALDPATADAVVRAASSTGVRSLMFVTYLFDPDTTAWIERMVRLAVERGPWEGAMVSCAGSLDRPGSPYSASRWRREHGGLWDLGPHALSLLGELLPPAERLAATHGVRDTINVLVQHSRTGGPSSYLTLTLTAPEVVCGSAITVWGPAGRHHRELALASSAAAYRRAVDELTRAIAEDRPHRLDAGYGARAVRILHAAQADAGSQKRPVDPLAL